MGEMYMMNIIKLKHCTDNELTKATIARDPTVVPEYSDVKALSTASTESESQDISSSSCLTPRGTYTPVTSSHAQYTSLHWIGLDCAVFYVPANTV